MKDSKLLEALEKGLTITYAIYQKGTKIKKHVGKAVSEITNFLTPQYDSTIDTSGYSVVEMMDRDYGPLTIDTKIKEFDETQDTHFDFKKAEKKSGYN